MVGYGGNDGSLMGLLHGLDQGDIAGRMVWRYREGSPPPALATEVLLKHNGVQVKIPGFDEFMLRLAAKLVKGFDVAAVAERTASLGRERADRYRQQAEELQKSLKQGTPEQRKTGEVLSQSVQGGNSWWAWELQARAEIDPDRRDEIYRHGLRQFPNSAELTGNYAIFPADQRKDYDAAEALYKKALELDPGNANTSANLALTLLCRAAENSVRQVGSLVRTVTKFSGNQPSQTLAEALLYDALRLELTAGLSEAALARLKGLLALGYQRGSWDFSPMFDVVLPKLEPAKRAFYRALGAAILDADRVGELDDFDAWRTIVPADPFANS